MRAIKIDPYKKTVEELYIRSDINKSFEELYPIMDCRTIQVYRMDERTALLLDDDGMAKRPQAFGIYDNFPFAGIAILIGFNGIKFFDTVKDKETEIKKFWGEWK